MFSGGHPSKYKPGPALLNFGERKRTGVLNVVWSLATETSGADDSPEAEDSGRFLFLGKGEFTMLKNGNSTRQGKINRDKNSPEGSTSTVKEET